jgi:hypothetical protein
MLVRVRLSQQSVMRRPCWDQGDHLEIPPQRRTPWLRRQIDTTGLKAKFPGSREFSREFFEKRAFSGDSGLKNVCEISGLQTNSLLAGAGNFFERSREFYRRSRELAPGSRAG